ncbi:MAG: DNA helicase UvrD, partial [Patescibacteria group bacterium]
ATIETDPAYGKYHYDGHRACNFSCSPAKTKELNGICPVCGKELTIGVDYRIEQLAKMPAGYFPAKRKKFYKILPLHEIIAFQLKSSLSSKKTWQLYNKLIEKFGSEFNVLIDVEKPDIIKAGFEQELAELIINNRIGNLKVKPGYDGVYGEIQSPEKQQRLF